MCKPASGDVRWTGTPTGSYYDHEVDDKMPEQTVLKRAQGVVVIAQTYFYAQQRASTELGLAPEHVEVKQCESKKATTVSSPIPEQFSSLKSGLIEDLLPRHSREGIMRELRVAGVTTVSRLLQMTEKDVLGIYGISHSRLKVIKESLVEAGLKLKEGTNGAG